MVAVLIEMKIKYKKTIFSEASMFNTNLRKTIKFRSQETTLNNLWIM